MVFVPLFNSIPTFNGDISQEAPEASSVFEQWDSLRLPRSEKDCDVDNEHNRLYVYGVYGTPVASGGFQSSWKLRRKTVFNYRCRLKRKSVSDGISYILRVGTFVSDGILDYFK